jgi:NAD(P)-dependent dehydrogenase (short-subunit alcohol dehydrogenase family)
MGVNHLGHFLLTSLLLPIISTGGRIVNHSSSAHRLAAKDFVFTDWLSEKSYSPWTAYGNSKIANLFFTYELNRRLAAAGNPRKIISVAVHPGTNLMSEGWTYCSWL